MDVEGNNIANVNTTGFKYSRANFSNLLSQTSTIATAPQGDLGGQNAMQIGLGTQVSTVTTLFEQGSIETTDKTTDLAIQGDGFFIVSPDGGDTYKYTRNGDFNFDADGNFVDSNGYIIQGWLRDDDTGVIDSTEPIQSITISSGLTTPAQATSYISLQANLNSGSSVENMTTIYSLDSIHGGVDLDGDGVLDTTRSENDEGDDLFDSDGNLYERGQDFGVLFDSGGDSLNMQEGDGIWVSYAEATYTDTVASVAAAGTYTVTVNGKTISITLDGTNTSTDDDAQDIATAINAYTDETGVEVTVTGSQLTFSNDNSSGQTKSTKNINIDWGDEDASGVSAAFGLQSKEVYTAFYYQYTDSGASPTGGTTPSTDDETLTARTFTTTEDLRYAMQNDAINNVNYDADADAGEVNVADTNTGVEVTINSSGQFQITNESGAYDMVIKVTGYENATNSVYENESFTDIMDALQGNLPVGSTQRTSESVYAATHASSIEVYDSLGSKHTVRFEFTKQTSSTENGATWLMVASVDEPGDLNGDSGSENIVTGTISFNSDGSLRSLSPSTLTFSPNNGAASNQNIDLEFGSSSDFDGLTSFDSESNTSGISQDGYTGGDLNGLRVDETGTIIGSFTNGRSFGLAQVAMASFNNQEGLESDGGNTYIQTSNSGEPIIGEADSGGRGYIQASSLEMSNVDLSRSLTELIVIQRGYQANSKTITTSDEMLQTLLQLK
jgi:flagellar hook protein FlgE